MNIEKEAIQLLRKGDANVYREIFNAFYTPLCQYALIYLDDTVEAEEIVHQFFIKLWEKRTELEIRISLKSYLFQSIRNQCFNHIRDQKRKMHVVDSLEELENELLQEIAVHEEMDLPTLKSEIEKAIQLLPPKCREIFLLSREKELSYREIAEELDVSKKTVENQMGIALKRLKEELSPILFLYIWYLY